MKESKVNRDNYINVQGWMVTELHLKGNELLIYACIYGFSQAENQTFSGSLQYLADWTNSSKQTVINCLKSLVDKELLVKMENTINGVKFCEYYTKKLNTLVKKVEYPSQKSLTGGSQKSLPNNLGNNNTNNNLDNKKESKSSFDTIIDNYAKGNEELTELLGEWLKVRKAKRSAMTDSAIQMNIDKLDKLAAESKMSVPDYLREVICRGWAAFFVINNYQKPQQPAKPNKFNNFQQRQYDYNAMERMLLNQQPKTAGEDPDIQRRAEELQRRLTTV